MTIVRTPSPTPAPVLSKAPSEPRYDYKEMTWPRFVAIRTWARATAEMEGAAVYLVGSVLWSVCPRDVDVAVVFPTPRFEERYGPLDEFERPNDRGGWDGPIEWDRDRTQWFYELMEATGWVTRIDVKPWPGCWWSGRQRLSLAP